MKKWKEAGGDEIHTEIHKVLRIVEIIGSQEETRFKIFTNL
jgi:hypothetical protein